MSRIIGCDPGLRGAFAVIDTEAWTIALTDMPLEPARAGKNAVSPAGVARIMDTVQPDYVMIEDVWSSPQMGIVSAWGFGRSLGIVEGACASRTILSKVAPAIWKRATSTPKCKNEARRRAMQLFPCAFDLFTRAKDDGRAEAALICFYGLLALLKTPPPQPLKLVPFPS